jgi:ATP-dependent helicase/nuclease subunit B
MPTKLLLAPVGAGKTGRALAALADTLQQDTFAKVWVLLPTRRQEDAFRQRLIDSDPYRLIYFNIEFFSFYTLYARLLDIAGIPQRQLDNTARLRLLRELLADLQREEELEIYGAIADKPGFIEVVADFIYELKQNLILPDTFGLATRTPKDRDLSKIYAAYQDKLRMYDLVDREGEGWLARDAVADIPEIGMDVDFLLVDGFDQLNPLQAQLLALLARRAHNALITLPTVPAREKIVGRRFQEAHIRLRDAFQTVREPLLVERVTEVPPFRRPELRYVIEKSFLPLAPQEKPLTGGSLMFLEAPDPSQEIGAVLRRVKRLLLTTDCPPDDVLIAVRDWTRYAGHLVAFGRSYQIPLALHYGEPLAENPAVIALLNLLDLSNKDFRRRDLFDVLRSPYFAIEGLDSTWVDLLEHVSQSQFVIGGRSEWLEAIALSTAPARRDEQDEGIVLTPAQVEHLTSYLAAFFDAVTPPAQASAGEYVNWLEDLIGADETDPDDADASKVKPLYSLRLFAQLRSDDAPESVVSRDLSAMHAFKRILGSLLAAQNLFAVLRVVRKPEQTWQSFLVDLKTALGAAAINRSPNRAGKVLVTTVADARGLPHRHVFIPGLSEGVFPAPVPEDPLYLDSERLVLTSKGVYLETSAERAADESLFYEIISQARETLTLSRPTIQNGVFWPESHLWRIVHDLFADAPGLIVANRLPLGGVVLPDDVAAPGEAVLAAASSLNRIEATASGVGLYNWLVTTDDPRWKGIQSRWKHILQGRQIELGRINGQGVDRYAGRLSHAGLIDWVAGQLGPERVWSASQFNEYGTCGFRFFAKRLMRLESWKEPEDGMDALQRGSIIHAILETTYRAIADSGFSIAPEYAETARDILRRTAAKVLRDAPAQYGFRASALWGQDKAALLRKLEKLIELDFSADSPLVEHFGAAPRRPYRVETPFSADGPVPIRISPNLDPLLVTGKIDRIDRQGSRVVVVDYKSGSAEIDTSEMRRGRNYQMMLYLHAVEKILENDPDADRPTEVAGGFFWHLPRNKASGVFYLHEEKDRQAMAQAAERLTEQILAGRAGIFSTHPNKAEEGRCHKHCEFGQMCRVSIAARGQ